MTSPEQPGLALAALDMAGTTVTGDGLVQAAFDAALDAAGIGTGSPDEPELWRHIRDTMGQSKIEVFRAVFDENTAQRANRAFEQCYADQIDTGRAAPMPGAPEAITALRDAGVKVVLTTGFSRDTQHRLVTALGWRDLADLVLCPEDAGGRGRPYPDMVLTAVLRLRVDDVANVAVVGDTASDLAARLIDTVLAVPSFLITLAFTFLYGSAGVLRAVVTSVAGQGAQVPPLPTSPLGVILAEITFFTPFVVRPLLAGLSGMPREQLEVAASLGAGPLRVLRTVVFPEVTPALAAGGSLVLLLTLNEFGIVLFTGAKDVITLPVLIYVRGAVSLDLPGAAVVATAQVALSLLLYGGYRVGFARLRARSGREGASDAAVVA